MIDSNFNAAVIIMANKVWPQGFVTSPKAPSTFDELVASVKENGFLIVWDGASENTMFGNPHVNHAFRAWHDFHHYTKALPFVREGEKRAMEYQQADLIAAFGNNETTAKWCKLLECEILGQFDYAEKHGDFPQDQMQFTLDYLTSH